MSLLAFATGRAPQRARERIRFVGLAGTVLAAENLALVTAIKLVWQRTRFDTMMWVGDDFAKYTPWFRPFGHGGDSFPSGHTADTVSLLVLIALCDVWPRLAKIRV